MNNIIACKLLCVNILRFFCNTAFYSHRNAFFALNILILMHKPMGLAPGLFIIIPILLIRFSGGLVYSNCVTQTIHNHPENAGAVSALFGTMAMTGGSVISAIVAQPHYKQIALSASLGVQVLIMFIMFSSVFFFKRKGA